MLRLQEDPDFILKNYEELLRNMEGFSEGEENKRSILRAIGKYILYPQGGQQEKVLFILFL